MGSHGYDWTCAFKFLPARTTLLGQIRGPVLLSPSDKLRELKTVDLRHRNVRHYELYLFSAALGSQLKLKNLQSVLPAVANNWTETESSELRKEGHDVHVFVIQKQDIVHAEKVAGYRIAHNRCTLSLQLRIVWPWN